MVTNLVKTQSDVDTKDLMRGDLVSVDRRVCRVLELGGMACVTPVDEYDEWFCNKDDIDPIPITPEILEKNGFDGEYKPNYKIYKEEGYSTLYISLWKGRLSIHKRPDIRKRHAATRLSMNCNYVHELQHALRLCGITLNIEV